MRLTVGERVYPIATEELIATSIQNFKADDDFVILRDGDTFIQAARAGKKYQIEYLDPEDGVLYELLPKMASRKAVAPVFLAFFRGDGEWKTLGRWARSEVQPDDQRTVGGANEVTAPSTGGWASERGFTPQEKRRLEAAREQVALQNTKDNFAALGGLLVLLVILAGVVYVGWQFYSNAASNEERETKELTKRSDAVVRRVLANNAVSRPAASNSESSSLFPLNDNFKSLREEIVRLDQDIERLRELAFSAAKSSNDASNRIEYNKSVKRGDAGTQEALILAKKIIENPAYEEQLRDDSFRYRREYSETNERAERLEELLVKYSYTLRSLTAGAERTSR